MAITRRSRRTAPRVLDMSALAEGLAGPDRDTRQWFSYGIVAGDGDPPVEFSRDDGQVYVRVRLEPSKTPVFARIATDIAGAGEGKYSPWIDGDEVVVALPDGREDGGAVIIGRLNNALDAFPMESVAGQDPTTNTFAFERRRTPYVQELAGPILFRSAESGALFSLDAEGTVTLKDGENSSLQISADAFSVQGPSSPGSAPEFLLQMNFTEGRGLFQIGDAQLAFNASRAPSLGGELHITVPSGVVVAIGNNQPVEHVATIEAVVALLVTALAAIPAGAGTPAITALNAAIAAGGSVLDPLSATAFATGLPMAATIPKPPATPAGVQVKPGLGAIFFRAG